jgi:hypothetical protein
LLPFGAALVDFLRGASTRGCQRLLVLAAIVVGLYSTQAHKEYRFILPALPLVLIVVAHKVVTAMQGAEAPSTKRVLGLLLLAQLPPAAYFSAYHMSAGQAVMDSLHKELSSNLAVNPSAELSVGFLTACHMTPWQAQLHLDIPLHVSGSAIRMVGVSVVVASAHVRCWHACSFLTVRRARPRGAVASAMRPAPSPSGVGQPRLRCKRLRPPMMAPMK